jgi:hypothetical protein
VTTGGLTVAVLGAGAVGRTLATGWSRAGHHVVLGTRELDHASAAQHADAVAQAHVVVLTVPGDQVPDLLGALGDALRGRVVVDATNRIGATDPSALALLRGVGAVTYRAYNSVGVEQMADPVFAGVASDLFFAGPAEHRALVEGLIRDTGFRPAYTGGDDGAYAAVDAIGRVWIQLVFRAGYGRRLGFRLLTAEDD